jgi:hypothetical protein
VGFGEAGEDGRIGMRAQRPAFFRGSRLGFHNVVDEPRAGATFRPRAEGPGQRSASSE